MGPPAPKLMLPPPTRVDVVILACLFHDIGYVRGILEGDDSDGYVIDAKGSKTNLPRGSSDAALTPYHVDRSKLYVMERIKAVKLVDASRIARAIEFTRFPSPPEPEDPENEEGTRIICARPTRCTMNSKRSE